MPPPTAARSSSGDRPSASSPAASTRSTRAPTSNCCAASPNSAWYAANSRSARTRTARAFLQRNRLIAALTRGTVVVEAARRSGSLNTARWAADLRRQVMAVPGPATSSLSAGPHELIRRGAVLVADAGEVVGQVGEIGTDLVATPEGRERLRDALAPETLRVLESLPASARGGSVESLVQRCLLGPDVVLRRLYELLSLGLVERLGAHWRLNPACKGS